MNASSKPLRALVLACASLGLIGSAQAQGHGGHGFGGGGHYAHGGYGGGYHGGGYRGGYRGGHGWGWGGLGLGLGLGVGLGLAGYYGNSYYANPYYADPGYVVVDPGPTYVQSQPVPAPISAPVQPLIYPRNGQSAAQMDADGNACSQWAGKQANAQVDPSVFQRGMAACMDARGYTVR